MSYNFLAAVMQHGLLDEISIASLLSVFESSEYSFCEREMRNWSCELSLSSHSSRALVHIFSTAPLITGTTQIWHLDVSSTPSYALLFDRCHPHLQPLLPLNLLPKRRAKTRKRKQIRSENIEPRRKQNRTSERRKGGESLWRLV